MELMDLFQRLGIALGIGLIIGLQRQRKGSLLAGFRTFPLVALLGALAGLMADYVDGWVLAAGLIALGGIIVMSNYEHRESAPGITTEVALLAMFLLAAFMMHGPIPIGIAIGGTITVLLHLKEQMHNVARKLEDPDFKAIMQFVLITLIILPVLPNRVYGPFQVLNPYKIWLMVVLIVGISLAGYIIYKFLGQKIGIFIGGILGGLISSTATTVSYSRRTRELPESSSMAAFVIMTASTVVFLRVLLIVGATAPAMLPGVMPPVATLLAVMLAVTLVLWWQIHKESKPLPPSQQNPSELKAALVFAGLYAVVLLAVAAAKQYFGSAGLYVVSILSGLTDMDAITLSVSQMGGAGTVSTHTVWRLIMIAALSNLVFKGITVAGLGSRELTRKICLTFGVSMAAGLAIVFLWPVKP